VLISLVVVKTYNIKLSKKQCQNKQNRILLMRRRPAYIKLKAWLDTQNLTSVNIESVKIETVKAGADKLTIDESSQVNKMYSSMIRCYKDELKQIESLAIFNVFKGQLEKTGFPGNHPEAVFRQELDNYGNIRWAVYPNGRIISEDE